MNSEFNVKKNNKEILASANIESLAKKIEEDMKMADMSILNYTPTTNIYDEEQIVIDLEYDVSDSPAIDEYESISEEEKQAMVNFIETNYTDDLGEFLKKYVNKVMSKNGYENLSEEELENIYLMIDNFNAEDSKITFTISFNLKKDIEDER